MKNIIQVVLSLLAFCQTTIAFHDIPHMLIAGIAKRDLLKNDPEVYKIAEKYMNMSNNEVPIPQVIFEENSIWGDDIKKYGNLVTNWNYWHFHGEGSYNPENIQYTTEALYKTENILVAYKNIKELLINKDFKGKIVDMKVLMLKMLIHLVGDAHMPHHAGTFYNSTEKFKNGDKGGTKFDVKLNGKKTDLHYFFDSGCNFYNFPKRIERPVNDTFISYFNGELDRLMALHSKESLTTQKLLNPQSEMESWIQESWSIATSFIYPNFQTQNEISKDFFDKSFEMIQKQIVLAGYRLSYTLTKVLTDEKGLHTFDTNTDTTKPPVVNPVDPNKPVVNPNDPNKNTNDTNKPSTNTTDTSKPTDNKTTDPSNNKPTTNIQTNQDSENSSRDYSHDDAVNKSVAIVFGVLFGLTFISLIAYLIVAKFKPNPQNSSQRYSGDLYEIKTMNDKRQSTLIDTKL